MDNTIQYRAASTKPVPCKQLKNEGTSIKQSVLLELLQGRQETLLQCLAHVLDCPESVVEHLVGLLGHGLQAQVHLGFRGVGHAVADELDIGVA